MKHLRLTTLTMITPVLVITGCHSIRNAETQSTVEKTSEIVRNDEPVTPAAPVSEFDNRRPFKYTITTAIDGEDKKYSSVVYGSNGDTVSILVSINSVDGKFPVKYDLDCDGDGVYEYIGLTDNQICTYKRNTGNYQIWLRGNIPGLWLCGRAEACEDVDLDGNDIIDLNGNHLDYRCYLPKKNDFVEDKLGAIHVDDAANAVLSVDDWGDIEWKSMYGFAGFCANLESIPKDAPDLRNVHDMSYMFHFAEKFNQPVQHWNVSAVTKMNDMFNTASSFNQPLEKWDMSNVTTIRRMFKQASAFNQPLGKWNVSNVKDTYATFSEAKVFNQPLENWDVSNVTMMSAMFFRASLFNQPLGNWDVSNVNNMSLMFDDADAFNQSLEHWNVSNVENMSSMFSNANSFNQPLNQWNVSNVKNMSKMFSNANSFNQPLDQWNVSNVKDMSRMFQYAAAFNQPLEKWDVSKVTNMGKMFESAAAFNQPLENWNVSNVIIMEEMFADAKSFNQPLNRWNTSSVCYMSGMFNQASNYSHYPKSWTVPDGVEVDSLVHSPMFDGTKVEKMAKKNTLKSVVKKQCSDNTKYAYSNYRDRLDYGDHVYY